MKKSIVVWLSISLVASALAFICNGYVTLRQGNSLLSILCFLMAAQALLWLGFQIFIFRKYGTSNDRQEGGCQDE